jgi:DNA mismatch repair protein MutL
MPSVGCSSAIQVLPGDVVSRIAAGEVIERPAAVVKELVENSLDAGSKTITVDVKDGGLSLIRVTDDGEGIARGELLLAFERHATSKLRSDRDLTSVTSMGFRGEALPSIASVSKLTVSTATEPDSVGAQTTLIGGVPGPVLDVAPVRGTRIEVAELFYNQPARKKFLRSEATEFSHVSHVVQQAGLAWPSVHFRMTHNGQEILNYPAVAEPRDRILQVYRPAFFDRMMEIKGRVPGYAVYGVAVDPLHAKSSKQPQDIFVNRRPVKSATVFHAVMEGYGSSLPKGRHPTFVLFLDIDPERIDVNVHPAKREVRFADSESIHRVVRHAVRHAMAGPERASVLDTVPEREMVPPRDNAATAPSFPARPPSSSGDPGGAAMVRAARSNEATQLPLVREDADPYTRPTAPEIHALGQLLRRYLVVQVGQELHVIDQHTAHERVLYQRLLRQWEGRAVASQPLLIPEPVELSPAHYSLVEHYHGDLAQLGLSIEPFGTSTVAIRAVPVGLGKIDAAAFTQDLLDDLAQWDRLPSLEGRVQPVLASLACHGAVRAGRAMGLPEIAQLVHDWVQEGLIATCPHGRRTAFRLSADELDKLFGRVGWV